MYETLFDIREVSILGLVSNWILVLILFVVIAVSSTIAWKLRRSNKIAALVFTGFQAAIIFVISSYFIKKGNAIDKLENGRYAIIEDRIPKIIKSGKYVVVNIGGTQFTVTGFGVITPYFNDKELIMELANSEEKIRLKHVNGSILMLEKKIE